MEISILCKVVDNYGDIGVAYRLAKRLVKVCKSTESSQLNSSNQFNINLIVDDLQAFNKICNTVSPEKGIQLVEGISVYNWNDYALCYSEFSKNDGEKLAVILECFQCGRPDWMEKILFEDKLKRTVQVIMIDYLTAEPYAETFHCLKSLTRSAKVQKVNFMPGFTEKTGGLIIDEDWNELAERNKAGGVLVFTYEKNWQPLVEALEEVQAAQKPQVKNNITQKKTILVAQGRGQKSFLEAVNVVIQKAGESADTEDCKLNVQVLPYMNQHDWDKLLRECSVLFIRGEESLSRACLSGIPFVWHAYPQSEEYQLVKVKALLERIRPHFAPEDFEIIEKVWLNINSPESEVADDKMKASCKSFLENADKLCYGYRDFALSLRKNGDLAQNLMTFIYKISIM